MKGAPSVLALALGGALTLMLLWATAPLRTPRPGLVAEAQAALEGFPLQQPVTAVLLVFRGHDTLLEVVVLLVALVATFAIGRTRSLEHVPPLPDRDPLLVTAAGRLAPLMVLTAGHLVALGTRGPGGAFQGGAVLGAAGVLLWLAGRRTLWALPGHLQRGALAAGLVAFLLAGAVPLLWGAPFLAWPLGAVAPLVLGLEVLLTVSIGATLSALFVAPHGPEPAEPGR